MRGVVPHIVILATFLLAGCGASKDGATGRQVLVEVDAQEPRADVETPGTQAFRLRLEDDARLAYQIIDQLLEQPEGPLAPWAAVYAMYLGLRIEPARIHKSLVRGTRAADLLVRTLSWRWLAAFPADSLEGAALFSPGSDDPVAVLWRDTVVVRSGHADKARGGAFRCPEIRGKATDSRPRVRERLGELLGMTTPFDNGLLAWSLLIVESRRYGWQEPAADGKTVPSCSRIATEFLDKLALSSEHREILIAQGEANAPAGRSQLLSELENVFLGSPVSSLRGATVTGPPTMRIAALRAIASKVQKPTSDDLGAASAAMQTDESAVRLEAARTFLLLTARIGVEKAR